MAQAQAAATHAVAPDDPALEASQLSGSESVDATNTSTVQRTYLRYAQQSSTDGATSRNTSCQAVSAAADVDVHVASSDPPQGNIERHQAFAVAAAAAEHFARRQLNRLRKPSDVGDGVVAATATPPAETVEPDGSVVVARNESSRRATVMVPEDSWATYCQQQLGFRPNVSFVDRTADGHQTDVGPSVQAVAYCSGKLNRLCRHQKSSRRADASGGGSKDGRAGRDAVSIERQPTQKKSVKQKAKVKRAATVQLPVEFKRKLNRMRIENLLHNLSEACKVQLHDPNRCRKCSKRLSEESRERFLQRHRTRLESALVAHRYESHLVRSTPLAAVGALAERLPRLGDSPSATWGRLMRKAAKPPE